MWQWLGEHKTVIITAIATIGFLIYAYGCEPRVRSLTDNRKLVNRQELQLELDRIMGIAELRLLSLDQQERFRSIILQNALVLVQGQPLNPVGIITAIAGIYGIAQGSRNVTKVVKNGITKRKVNNG